MSIRRMKGIVVFSFFIAFTTSICITFAGNETPEVLECKSIYNECLDLIGHSDIKKITFVRDYAGSNYGKWQRYDENKKGDWISQFDLYISNNQLRSVTYFEVDPGGDTALHIEYYFRNNGTTAYWIEDYRILSGIDHRTVTTVDISSKGTVVGRDTQLFDLMNKKGLSNQRKTKEDLPKIFLNTRDLLQGYQIPLFMDETDKPSIFIQSGHEYRVETVALSPDGKYVATGSGDGYLKLWDFASGREIKTFHGHADIVFSVAFSPDGKYIVSGSQDKTVKIWDIQTGKELKSFTDEGFIKWVGFSADGKSVYSYLTGKDIKKWDLETGQIIKILNYNPGAIALSKDRKYLIRAFFNSINLLDVEDEKSIGTFSLPPQEKFVYINSLAVSPDNKLILSADSEESGALRLWKVENGENLMTIPAGSGYYGSVAISPDGKLGLSTDKNNAIKLWDLTTGAQLKSFIDKTSDRHALLFSPNCKYALIGSGALRLWDLSSGKEVERFTRPIDKFRYAAFSTDHKKAFTIASDHSIKLWDLTVGKPVQTFAQRLDTVWDIAFSPDNRYALTGSGNDTDFSDNNMRLWDIKKGKVIKTFSGHRDAIAVVAFSPDGKLAVSGSNDNSMILWDIETGKMIRTYKGHKDSGHTSLYLPIACLAFSPDGSFVISGSDDTTLKLWDTRTNFTIRLFGNIYNPLDSDKGKAIKTLTGHTGTVTCVTISSNGKYALSGSEDKTIRLWDIEKGKSIRTFSGRNDTIYFVDFSPDNKLALSGSYDGTIKIWDLTSGKLIKSISGEPSHFITGCFSKNGKYIIAAASDSTMRLYNLKTSREEVRMISFSNGDWVNITVDGFFNCSNKGSKYITVSNNLDTYPMEGIYYDVFFRPEVIARKIKNVFLDGK